MGQRFAKHGFDILVFDYRGYGASDGVAALITHGDPDLTIPTAEAYGLFASANEPKKLLILPGAGHVVFGSMGEPYLAQVEQFIRDSIANDERITTGPL